MYETTQSKEVKKKGYSVKGLVGKQASLVCQGREVIVNITFFLNGIYKGTVLESPTSPSLHGREISFKKGDVITINSLQNLH